MGIMNGKLKNDDAMHAYNAMNDICKTCHSVKFCYCNGFCCFNHISSYLFEWRFLTLVQWSNDNQVPISSYLVQCNQTTHTINVSNAETHG